MAPVIPIAVSLAMKKSKPQPQSDVGLLPPPLVEKKVLLYNLQSLTPLVVPRDARTPNFWS